MDKNPHSLSGGYKRRLALAIQLVRIVANIKDPDADMPDGYYYKQRIRERERERE